MSGQPAWPEPGRELRSGAPRRGFVIFALALTAALGTVLMVIAASSVQAMSHSAALNAKSDSWVGLAAVVSVLVCALLGMVIVHRYFTSRQR